MAFHRLIATLRADLSPASERGRMVRSAGMTAALKVGATLIAFGASLIYARALGPHGYGLYAYVIAWASIITIPVTLGLPGYLVREGAKMPASVDWLCRWADKRVIIAGIVAAIFMACIWFIPQAADARELFVIAALLPLITALQQIRSALLRARNRIARSQWPNMIAGPALMLAVLAILWWVRGRLYPVEVIAAMVGAALLALIINGFQLRHARIACTRTPETSVRLRAALPFMWLGGMYLLNNRVDLIMLGAINGAHDAGIYAIATRAAMLVMFVMQAANMTLAPRIARLYHSGDHVLLQRMITSAARRVLLLSLPLAVVLLALAWWLLYYLYGAEFTSAALPLQILAGSQIIAISFGSGGIILNMAGQEKLNMMGEASTLALNIALNAILIPFWGPVGAAIATGTSLVARRILLWAWIRQRLQINSSAFTS